MDMTSYLSMSNQACLRSFLLNFYLLIYAIIDALLLVTYLVILMIYPSTSEQRQKFRLRHLARDNKFSYLKEYYLLQNHEKTLLKQ